MPSIVMGRRHRQSDSALTLVARQQSNEAASLSGMLPKTPGDLQSLVAQLIASSTAGRELALSVLNQLLPMLPPALQSTVAQLIAQLFWQPRYIRRVLRHRSGRLKFWSHPPDWHRRAAAAIEVCRFIILDGRCHWRAYCS